MIISYCNLFRSGVRPPEDDAPLFVDANPMLFPDYIPLTSLSAMATYVIEDYTVPGSYTGN